jgi:ankyrin repeat protein
MRFSAFLAGLTLTALAVPAIAQNYHIPPTTLVEFAAKGDLEGVKARVALGEKVNQIDKWGWTPLHWASYNNSVDVTGYLLEHGADPNASVTKPYGEIVKGSTPLIIAGYYGNAELVGPLLTHGARPDLADVNGMKAADYARQFHFKVTLALLEHPEPAAAKPAAPQSAVVPPPM